ncbi:adenylate/guanylate cyclase domain-containing protein [Roseovarius sp. MMSF_3359]|uniref:adenylate/guanylate cyclase domain-containing protein n=1 Tax=Roseovarius sp. MMSF_3359 TaxID=3046707 RepID=UPI00273D2F85|nr:adenylate/guanylate cyclase domain-containing protein [Roseovarius sp. MMSF_3359]
MDTPDQPTSDSAIRRTFYVPQLRIASGLILFTFAITHFINHALGLVSLDTMQAGQDIRVWVTQSAAGTALLITAATVHFVLGIAKFIGTRTWRLGRRDFIQLIFGLLIPLFLIRHVLGTRGVQEMFGIEADYTYAMWAMWPNEALSQALLMTLVWVHGCIGMHHWLIVRAWYRRSLWLWYGLAVGIPALAYAGYVAAGRVSALQSSYSNPFSAEQYATFVSTLQATNTVYYAILAGALGIWLLLLTRQRFSGRVIVTYANGPIIPASRGLSVLDISRINRVPHASVCGGRARCSTCRVRVIEGHEMLPPPTEIETTVLKRVAAPANVRLACQLRPTANLTISTLMPGNIDATRGVAIDRYHWGVERDATILFCDLRGFTKMSEGKLSYDVVFLLNQFLGRMAEAIQDSGGYVDKFMGDGIMAIFGMETSIQDSAVRAIKAARAMGGVLDGLNQSLQEELPEPLQIGIGLNTGPVVLGRIGAGHRTDAAARITALGETVNTASRLEGLTKSMEVQIIVSNTTIAASGLTPGDKMARQSVDVRGLSQPIIVYTVKRATDLPSSESP